MAALVVRSPGFTAHTECKEAMQFAAVDRWHASHGRADKDSRGPAASWDRVLKLQGRLQQFIKLQK